MSTEGQQYSTENQMAAIQEYAHKNGFEIVRTYGDEARSGLDLKHRPGLSKLRDLTPSALPGNCSHAGLQFAG
jgi:DNA invertase Pin-like site-specific DNA recombinase